jgi:anti-anti-sigma regulatory factor
MATSAVWVKVDEATFAQKLQQVCAQLSDSEGEIVLDLSSVHRIGTDALRAIEELVKTAGDKNKKVALRGVNVDIYKVLKVAKLTARFSFLN